MTPWYLIFATKNLTEASIIKGMLEENQIRVMMLNKQDSSMLYGDIEIYVPVHFKEIAKGLLDKGLLN